jgi:hypothetical protein
MTKHLSIKTKKIVSRRVITVIYIIALLALALIPFITHVPLILIIEVLLAAFIIGALSGIIANQLLQTIFGFVLVISAAGYIVGVHPDYLRSLFALLLIVLLFANGTMRLIAKKVLPYDSTQFQLVVSTTAVLILAAWSLALPFYLHTQTPLIALLLAVGLSLVSGYTVMTVLARRTMKFRKPILITIITALVVISSIFMYHWPVLLMVTMINFFNGIYISAILRQANAHKHN